MKPSRRSTSTSCVDVGVARVPGYPADGRPFGDGGFPTASGKVELRSDRLTRLGQPALPTFVARASRRTARRRSPTGIPCTLLTPKQHTRFLNSGYAHLPRHGGLEDGPLVELDPHDAATRGIRDGDTVEVRNDRAVLRLTARLAHGCSPGWWRSRSGGGAATTATTGWPTR